MLECTFSVLYVLKISTLNLFFSSSNLFCEGFDINKNAPSLCPPGRLPFSPIIILLWCVLLHNIIMATLSCIPRGHPHHMCYVYLVHQPKKYTLFCCEFPIWYFWAHLSFSQIQECLMHIHRTSTILAAKVGFLFNDSVFCFCEDLYWLAQ